MKDRLKFLFAVALTVVFFAIIGCPFRRLLGISCLGCGMSRAWLSALSLNIPKAFEYHPLWLAPLVYAFVYLFRHDSKVYKYTTYILIFLFIAVYIIRLVNNDPIVVFNIKEGLLYKLLTTLKVI